MRMPPRGPPALAISGDNHGLAHALPPTTSHQKSRPPSHAAMQRDRFCAPSRSRPGNFGQPIPSQRPTPQGLMTRTFFVIRKHFLQFLPENAYTTLGFFRAPGTLEYPHRTEPSPSPQRGGERPRTTVPQATCSAGAQRTARNGSAHKRFRRR